MHLEACLKQELGGLNVNQLRGPECESWLGGEGLPHERTVERAAGKIIKGLTAILVGHLLFNQNVSSISCSPEALGPKFLCLLQHMVAEACHEKLIILQGREVLFLWVQTGAHPFPGLPTRPASWEGEHSHGRQGGAQRRFPLPSPDDGILQGWH